jgi:putative two-component system response regulator
LSRMVDTVPLPPITSLSLDELLSSALVPRSEWERLPSKLQQRLQKKTHHTELLPALVEQRLLTSYQSHRLSLGQRFGLLLGEYRVLDRIGSGTMAVIFRGEHRQTRRRVALKVFQVLPGQNKRALQRFIQEVRITTRVRHPHIVHTIGAGATRSSEPTSPDLLYFVMEYVPGEDLEERVRKYGPLPVDQVVRIARQLADALLEADRRRLVHRDIKPGNVRLTPAWRAKLLDFGLALWGSDLDEPGQPLGTLPYMAPEQVYQAHRVDIRADLYGLGGTLFWCLTGKPPFPIRGSALEQLSARLKQLPPVVRELRPEVPEKLDVILQKLLALQPADRFATPAELLTALCP